MSTAAAEEAALLGLDHQHEAGHGHGGHAHGPGPGHATRPFAIAMAINLAYTAVEAGYGFHAHSLALLSDALHNLGDSLGLGLAFVTGPFDQLYQSLTNYKKSPRQ